MHEATPSLAARIRAEGPLWPWIARFFWSPAQDIHPTRRAALLPGLDAAAWDSPRALRHASSHLLAVARLDDEPAWDSARPDFRVALLPPSPLETLARRMGLALRRPVAPEDVAALAPAERDFLLERARLYWRGATVAGDGPAEATGWQALRELLAGQPAAVRQRFGWKTPSTFDPTPAAQLDVAPGALQALALRLLRESEAPWPSLFATLPR